MNQSRRSSQGPLQKDLGKALLRGQVERETHQVHSLRPHQDRLVEPCQQNPDQQNPDTMHDQPEG